MRDPDRPSVREKGAWLRGRCYHCGHRLRFDANACPQCGTFFDGRKEPKRYPQRCACERCVSALGKEPTDG